MSGYWLGVLTPFMIVLGILLLWLAGSLFAAIVSWAWKRAHYGLLKEGWIAEDYDEDSRESTTAMTSIAACPCPVVPVNGCNRSPTFN